MRDDLHSVNVVLRHGYAGDGRFGWWATLTWQDSRWCESGTVEGSIRTRYGEETIAAAIDAVLEVEAQFGLQRVHLPQSGPEGLLLCLKGDGENPDDHDDLPRDWRALLADEARRRGWPCPYEVRPEVSA